MSTYTDPAHFDRLYGADPDPWKFATSDYERDKYAATLAALPDRRFTRCYEVGCSIGVLTRQLAPRCDAILASRSRGGENLNRAIRSWRVLVPAVAAFLILGIGTATADVTSGVFRDLVVTGRSRIDLYAARVPAGGRLTVPVSP